MASDTAYVAAAVLFTLDKNLQVKHSQHQVAPQLTLFPLAITDTNIFFETWLISTWHEIES